MVPVPLTAHVLVVIVETGDEGFNNCCPKSNNASDLL